MIFPDIVQGMSDRNTKQCLVESLGNRECLVYQEDEEKLLYKGAGIKVLLERIQIAAQALENEITPFRAKTRVVCMRSCLQSFSSRSFKSSRTRDRWVALHLISHCHSLLISIRSIAIFVILITIGTT